MQTQPAHLQRFEEKFKRAPITTALEDHALSSQNRFQVSLHCFHMHSQDGTKPRVDAEEYEGTGKTILRGRWKPLDRRSNSSWCAASSIS